MSRVAVILPVYKKDFLSYFQKSVRSIQCQTFKDVHLFIGVDGPINDDMKEYLTCLDQQKNITTILYEENRGTASVLNDLLDICFKEGYDYIARMDADDISLPDRLEKQMKFLQSHTDIDVVGGAILEIDENGMSRKKIIIYPETPEECRCFFSKRNPHAHPAVMFRNSYFEKTGCKYRPDFRQNQDTMLWFDGMMAGTQHANIPDIVLEYRITNSMFKKRRNGWTFAKKQLKDRLMINRGLGFGWKADVYGFTMFCLLISPVWIKKIAYRLLR